MKAKVFRLVLLFAVLGVVAGSAFAQTTLTDMTGEVATIFDGLPVEATLGIATMVIIGGVGILYARLVRAGR
jgi:uncharacterized membrane-anchored protein